MMGYCIVTSNLSTQIDLRQCNLMVDGLEERWLTVGRARLLWVKCYVGINCGNEKRDVEYK